MSEQANLSRCECGGQFDHKKHAYIFEKCAHCREVGAVAREMVEVMRRTGQLLREHWDHEPPVGFDEVLARAEKVFGK